MRGSLTEGNGLKRGPLISEQVGDKGNGKWASRGRDSAEVGEEPGVLKGEGKTGVSNNGKSSEASYSTGRISQAAVSIQLWAPAPCGGFTLGGSTARIKVAAGAVVHIHFMTCLGSTSSDKELCIERGAGGLVKPFTSRERKNCFDAVTRGVWSSAYLYAVPQHFMRPGSVKVSQGNEAQALGA
ncbi:hypothetical protein FA13DRAFT_1715261 [Coprinellus micaceus]|uniref:Uncharacterized protein n=1 Tax=Coprinellus micaceus TaxID=71717 RepID=A0A4Y7SPN7_COPMI|nr:hypothetical protein FA13DRAFT_1715261 [Coprinellus micaceus]